MSKKVEQFLKALGIKSAVIEKITAEGSEADVKQIAGEFLSDVKEAQKELVLNDKELRSDIEKEVRGKVVGTFKNDLKKRFELGLSNKEVQEAEPHELLEKVADKLKEAGSETGDKVSELQQKNVELKNELTELKERKIPEIESRVFREISKAKTSQLIKDRLVAWKGEGNLVPSIDGAFRAVEAVLSAEADTIVNDKGELEIFVAGSDRKERFQGEVGGVEKILSADEYLQSKLKTFEFWRKSNGQGGGSEEERKQLTAEQLSKLGSTTKRALSEAEARLKEMS